MCIFSITISVTLMWPCVMAVTWRVFSFTFMYISTLYHRNLSSKSWPVCLLYELFQTIVFSEILNIFVVNVRLNHVLESLIFKAVKYYLNNSQTYETQFIVEPLFLNNGPLNDNSVQLKLLLGLGKLPYKWYCFCNFMFDWWIERITNTTLHNNIWLISDN